MSTKSIVLGIIILAAIGAGGYYLFMNYSPATPTEETADVQDPVQVQDIVVGEGAEAVPGSAVSVLYVGRLEDGTVFDSSEAYGNEPLPFVLGEPGLIPGFQIGVNGMKVGGERVIAVPPSLGYGAQGVTDTEGKVRVPPNVTIYFNIKLVSVGEAPAKTTPETAAETE